jgi:hypothetical protein
MERDFLGAIGRTKEEPHMEEVGGGKPESGRCPPSSLRRIIN